MRVAMLDPSGFSPSYTHRLCGGLAANGHEVTLFTTRSSPIDDPDRSYRREDHFYRYTGTLGETRPAMRLAVKGLEHVWDIGRLVRTLQSWNPDVIHFQWFPLPVADQVILRRLHRIAPVVHTVHDSDPYRGAASAWLQYLAAKHIRKQVTRLVVHTAYTRNRLIRDGIDPSTVAIIPHGLLHLDGDVEEPRPEPTQSRILFFGTLKPYKGLETLIRAFSMLPSAYRRDATLHVVGRAMMDLAPLRSLARREGVQQRIEWQLGYLPEQSLGSILDRTTVLALPYRHIDQSGVLITAVGAGIPVVATDVGGIPETITDGTHGYLVPPNDPPAFADALTRILEDSHRRARMAEAMRDLVREWPSWTAIGAETANFYETL